MIVSKNWYTWICRLGGIISHNQGIISVEFPHGKYMFEYNYLIRNFIIKYEDGRVYLAKYSENHVEFASHLTKYYSISYRKYHDRYVIIIDYIHYSEHFIVYQNKESTQSKLKSIILPDNSASMSVVSNISFKHIYRSNTGMSITHEYQDNSIHSTISQPGRESKKIVHNLYDWEYPIYPLQKSART